MKNAKTFKRKLKEWGRRYLPGEIIGTISALVGAYWALLSNGNLLFVAFAGSIGEAIGFYTTIFVQNFYFVFRKCKLEKRRFGLADLRTIAIDVALEFGPAGVIDDLIIRPIFMYTFPLILNNFFYGILVGKFLGDLSFYLLVVLSYEVRGYAKDKVRDKTFAKPKVRHGL